MLEPYEGKLSRTVLRGGRSGNAPLPLGAGIRSALHMVKHIVFWTLKEWAAGRCAADNGVEIRKRLEALNGKIPGLIHLEVGIDFSHTEASGDVALYAEFESREALKGYQSHPEHSAAAEFISDVRESRLVVDYEV